MVWTIAMILLILWGLGMWTSAMSGYIHILLLGAAILLMIRLVLGRRPQF